MFSAKLSNWLTNDLMPMLRTFLLNLSGQLVNMVTFFKNILLRPHFIKGLKRFEARHRSPYGEIVSRWEWKGKCVHYEVTVPANSTATLTLPDKAENVRVVELAAGRYEFIVK